MNGLVERLDQAVGCTVVAVVLGGLCVASAPEGHALVAGLGAAAFIAVAGMVNWLAAAGAGAGRAMQPTGTRR